MFGANYILHAIFCAIINDTNVIEWIVHFQEVDDKNSGLGTAEPDSGLVQERPPNRIIRIQKQ